MLAERTQHTKHTRHTKHTKLIRQNKRTKQTIKHTIKHTMHIVRHTIKHTMGHSIKHTIRQTMQAIGTRTNATMCNAYGFQPRSFLERSWLGATHIIESQQSIACVGSESTLTESSPWPKAALGRC
jgi:hypothetical protein